MKSNQVKKPLLAGSILDKCKYRTPGSLRDIQVLARASKPFQIFAHCQKRCLGFPTNGRNRSGKCLSKVHKTKNYEDTKEETFLFRTVPGKYHVSFRLRQHLGRTATVEKPKLGYQR
ncbi:hypothetical protein ABW19_dt0201067 [Dactylella cylindrospora]|nr:hypothetical protein ABW19_dt0201067 [Dactylella cylindrospora]